MKWSLNEINKKKVIDFFEEKLDLTGELQTRSSDILAAEPVVVTGQVRYDDSLYFLDYQAQTTLTLPSSRSLKPVKWPISLSINEIFVPADDQASLSDLTDEEVIIFVENNLIDLDESVADNILLEIPLQILAPDEKASDKLPAGQNWEVISEEEFERRKAEKAAEQKSPFADLNKLFDK